MPAKLSYTVYRGMFAVQNKLKIFNSVIESVAAYVMNVFICFELPTELFLHRVAVFIDPLFSFLNFNYSINKFVSGVVKSIRSKWMGVGMPHPGIVSGTLVFMLFPLAIICESGVAFESTFGVIKFDRFFTPTFALSLFVWFKLWHFIFPFRYNICLKSQKVK